MKRINKEMEEELDDSIDDPNEIDKEIESVEEVNYEKLFDKIDKKFQGIEKAITILQKWVKKNRDDIDRIDSNFMRLVDKK